MEYIEQKLPQEEVNRKGSKLWIQMNDNSRAKTMRESFVKQYGGFFKQVKKEWVWVSPVEQKNGFWLINMKTNTPEFFTNMGEFAKANGMTSVKVCEVLNGKRKSYKGWTALETRPVKETVGQHVKEKVQKKKKIGVPKMVNLVNIETNEVIVVANIKQFAKEHGIFPANLYKLVNGKAQTVKNFKLHTPI